MSRLPRRAIPRSEERERVFVSKGAVTAEDLGEAGKLQSAGLKGSGIKLDEEDDEDEVGVYKLYAPILKANDEEQVVTGVVLEPEEIDGHGDIYDSAVIRKAAFDFIDSYYKRAAKLGLMHKDFTKDFALREFFLAPHEMVVNNKTIKQGSWVMSVKVNDPSVWKLVKSGKLTGFSIGGKAKVKMLENKAEG